MPERVLIAVDESEAARKAVEYVGRMFGTRGAPDAEITLFHVAEELPHDLLARGDDPKLGRAVGEALRYWSEHAAERARKLLDEHRGRLVTAGVPHAAVQLKHVVQEARAEARRVVAALAIIDEARGGGYTTVVVGRRGSSNIPELFLGGVAEKVARHVSGATVWIVD